MRDVQGGWLIRYMHANGASFFFACMYAHIGKAIYYGSYKAPRTLVWVIGVIIFVLTMATAFMGYSNNSPTSYNKKNNKKNNNINNYIVPSLLGNKKEFSPFLRGKVSLGFYSLHRRNLYLGITISPHYLSPPLHRGREYGDSLVLGQGGSSHLHLNEGRKFSSTPSGGSSYYINPKQDNTKPQIIFESLGINVKDYWENLHDHNIRLKIIEKLKNKSGIYIIINKISHNIYVGSATTNNLYKRFTRHMLNLNGSKLVTHSSPINGEDITSKKSNIKRRIK